MALPPWRIAALRNFRRPLAATELPLSAVLRLSVVFLPDTWGVQRDKW
jgi:hypothetical protein